MTRKESRLIRYCMWCGDRVHQHEDECESCGCDEFLAQGSLGEFS